MEIVIRQIEPGDRLSGLSLGEEYVALKTFLRRHAAVYHSNGLGRTYIAASPEGKLFGYITLV